MANIEIQGIIFDFDGTLADTLPVCWTAFRQVFHDYLEREYTDAEITALFGPSEEGIIRRQVGDRWEEAYRAYLDAYEAAHDACIEPFPGVVELLDLLTARHVPVGIVTGKGEGSLAISLRRLGLRQYFHVIETGSPEAAVKSDAILRIMNHWNVLPKSVIYVGDSPADVDEAREAGVTPIAAAWAPTVDHAALRARQPDRLFTGVDTFTRWVQQQIST